jgi:hypothetical protein
MSSSTNCAWCEQMDVDVHSTATKLASGLGLFRRRAQGRNMSAHARKVTRLTTRVETQRPYRTESSNTFRTLQHSRLADGAMHVTVSRVTL